MARADAGVAVNATSAAMLMRFLMTRPQTADRRAAPAARMRRPLCLRHGHGGDPRHPASLEDIVHAPETIDSFSRCRRRQMRMPVDATLRHLILEPEIVMLL